MCMWKRLSILIVVASCSERVNPNVCCVTEEACAALGLDELRPCGPGQACGPSNGCVAAECETSSDCSATEPVCTFGLCEACVANDDCAASSGTPYCLSPTCVECTESSQYSSARAICDSEDHVCRGCEADDECTSGVCIEIDDVCAEKSRVVYLSIGGSNVDCTRGLPCGDLTFALTRIGPGRDVLRIVAPTLDLPAQTITVARDLIIDGGNTSMVHHGATPAFSVSQGVPFTLEGVTLLNNVEVHATRAPVRAFDVRALAGRVLISGGSLVLRTVALEAGSLVSCTEAGDVFVQTSNFSQALLGSDACTVRVERTRFQTSGRAADLFGGSVTVENSIFVATNPLSDLVRVAGGNHVVHFNTFVNTSSIAADGVAFECDGNTVVSSNIFAYNSANPIGGSCPIINSLFDLAGASDAGGNATQSRNAIFVDFAGGDLHLASGSTAKDGGEAGLVTIDFDGAMRKASPDIGAYEAR